MSRPSCALIARAVKSDVFRSKRGSPRKPVYDFNSTHIGERISPVDIRPIIHRDMSMDWLQWRNYAKELIRIWT